MSKSNTFGNFARRIADYSGHSTTSVVACSIILVWLITGPIFLYSDTWQLVINTGTSIITFLMVFLIQNTQNRDSAAIQIKLDELIRAHEGAHNVLLDLEELTQDQLDTIKKRYEHLAKIARADLKQGLSDTHNADV
jgi:low affinity Fe/Cu permease